MNDVDRLDSWKAIAKYIKRDTKTCLHWARELGFPVRRVDGQSNRSRVFAYKTEIDAWFHDRKLLNNSKPPSS